MSGLFPHFDSRTKTLKGGGVETQDTNGRERNPVAVRVACRHLSGWENKNVTTAIS